MNNNILSSLLALETSSILSLIVFFSLINPRFYYSKRVIFACFVVTLFWFAVTVFSIIKAQKKKGITSYFVSSLIYLLVIFYMIRTVWFHTYLTLAPEYSFFNGLGNSDTFYLAGLGEAIKNYGYPALLSKGLALHKYHCLSNAFLAGISRACKVPCLITYNLLYPVVFLPLFTFLFFQAIGVVREYLNKSKSIVISDVVLSLFVIAGFLPLRYSNAISIVWFDIFLSESYCVSLILLLMYILIINKVKTLKNTKFIIVYLLTPLFIIAITGAKISSGIIFFIAFSWYFIREEGIKISTLLVLFLEFCVVLFSLYLFTRNEEKKTDQMFFWFHFIKTCVASEYIISHVFFVFFPALSLFILTKGKQPFCDFIKTKNSIMTEIAIITTFCSMLPGVFFEIAGGSALYFVFPAMFISLFFLLCSSVVSVSFSNCRKELKIIICMLYIVVYGESFINESFKYGSGQMSISPNYIIEQCKIRKQGNLDVKKDPFYKILTEINKITEGKKEKYCLFVQKNCNILNLYPGKSYIETNNLLAITAYLGIPVLNIPENNQPITIKLIKEKANEININNVIILGRNKYKIVN